VSGEDAYSWSYSPAAGQLSDALAGPWTGWALPVQKLRVEREPGSSVKGNGALAGVHGDVL